MAHRVSLIRMSWCFKFGLTKKTFPGTEKTLRNIHGATSSFGMFVGTGRHTDTSISSKAPTVFTATFLTHGFFLAKCLLRLVVQNTSCEKSRPHFGHVLIYSTLGKFPIPGTIQNYFSFEKYMLTSKTFHFDMGWVRACDIWKISNPGNDPKLF